MDKLIACYQLAIVITIDFSQGL